MTNFSSLIRRTAATVATGILAGTALTSSLPTTAGAGDLTGSIEVSNGTLVVTQAPDGVLNFEADIVVIDNRRVLTFYEGFESLAVGSGCAEIDTPVGPRITCSGFRQIVVTGGDLRDYVDLTLVTTPSVIYGGEGDDRLLGGRANDRIFGHGGDDWLEDTDQPGQSSSDRLDGGPGDFDILITGFGADVYIGGTGLGDRVLYQNQYHGSTPAKSQGVYVKADQYANDGASGEGDFVAADIEYINGGAGNDTLIAPTVSAGSTVTPVLSGEAGDDTLIGSNGNDWIRGDSGKDFADGAGGIDFCGSSTEVKMNCES